MTSKQRYRRAANKPLKMLRATACPAHFFSQMTRPVVINNGAVNEQRTPTKNSMTFFAGTTATRGAGECLFFQGLTLLMLCGSTLTVKNPTMKRYTTKLPFFNS